jgi:hypothetical protein
MIVVCRGSGLTGGGKPEGKTPVADKLSSLRRRPIRKLPPLPPRVSLAQAQHVVRTLHIDDTAKTHQEHYKTGWAMMSGRNT